MALGTNYPQSNWKNNRDFLVAAARLYIKREDTRETFVDTFKDEWKETAGLAFDAAKGSKADAKQFIRHGGRE